MFNDWDDLVDSSLDGSFSFGFSSLRSGTIDESTPQQSPAAVATTNRNSARPMAPMPLKDTDTHVDKSDDIFPSIYRELVSDQIAWLLMRMHTANERDATDLKKFWATNYRVMLEREPEPGQMWEEVPDTTGKYQRSIEIEDLLVETPDWAYCAVCDDVYKAPMKWYDCQHSFCTKCIAQTLTSGHRHCPLCRQFIPHDIGINELDIDTDMMRKLEALTVRCRWGLRLSQQPASSSPIHAHPADSEQHLFSPATSSPGPSWRPDARLLTPDSPQLAIAKWVPDPIDGCPTTLPLSQLRQHLLDCSFAPVRCTYQGCGRILTRKSITKHQADECPFVPTPCKYCQQSHPRGSIQFHEMECPDATIPCPNVGCQASDIKRKDMKEHLASTCQYQLTRCPNSQYGCKWQGLRRDLLALHLHDDTIVQADKPSTTDISDYSSSNNNSASSLVRQQDAETEGCAFVTLARVFDAMQLQLKSQSQQIKRLEDIVDQQQSEIRELRSALMRPRHHPFPSQSGHHHHHASSSSSSSSSPQHHHPHSGRFNGGNASRGNGSISQDPPHSRGTLWFGVGDDGNSPDEPQFGLQMFTL